MTCSYSSASYRRTRLTTRCRKYILSAEMEMMIFHNLKKKRTYFVVNRKRVPQMIEIQMQAEMNLGL